MQLGFNVIGKNPAFMGGTKKVTKTVTTTLNAGDKKNEIIIEDTHSEKKATTSEENLNVIKEDIMDIINLFKVTEKIRNSGKCVYPRQIHNKYEDDGFETLELENNTKYGKEYLEIYSVPEDSYYQVKLKQITRAKDKNKDNAENKNIGITTTEYNIKNEFGEDEATHTAVKEALELASKIDKERKEYNANVSKKGGEALGKDK